MRRRRMTMMLSAIRRRQWGKKECVSKSVDRFCSRVSERGREGERGVCDEVDMMMMITSETIL
eukprot:14821575-Ditylum_brightwellii.AAC.1